MRNFQKLAKPHLLDVYIIKDHSCAKYDDNFTGLIPKNVKDSLQKKAVKLELEVEKLKEIGYLASPHHFSNMWRGVCRFATNA